MPSKGSIGLKRRYLSHSRPKSSTHIQSAVCSTKPKPSSKKNSKKIVLVTFFIKGIHAKAISTSDEEKVELFSWFGVRMEHLIDKISNVPLDSLPEKVNINAGMNYSKFKIPLSSSTLKKNLLSFYTLNFLHLLKLLFINCTTCCEGGLPE